MFIPVNSSALLQSLDRSLPLLSTDYIEAYHDSDPAVSRALLPERFDSVLAEIVALSRIDAGVGGIVQAAAPTRAAIASATPIILVLVSRWTAPFAADAPAWELAVAAMSMRGVDDAAA